jgi:hypothetical protein
LLKKEPLFVCGLSVFLSFRVLQKFRPPTRMIFFCGIFWTGPPISRSWITKPAPLIKKQSPSSGMPPSNSSLQTCIAATGRSAPFTHSRTTSWQSWPALIQPFDLTFGTSSSRKLNLPSISSNRPLSTLGSVHGIFFQGPFDFNKIPLGLVVCCTLIHANPASCRSWDFRAKNGFYIGPALESYRCFKLVIADTKSQVIPDTVEFRHSYLSVPAPSMEDQIVHGIQVVARALARVAPPISISQVDTIANLQDIFESWCLRVLPAFRPMHSPLPGCPSVLPHEPPRVISLLPPTPGLPRLLVPSWSLPPRPAASTLSSPVLFTYYLRTVCTLTNLVAQI